MNRPAARQPVDDSGTSWVGAAGFMKLNADSRLYNKYKILNVEEGELMNV